MGQTFRPIGWPETPAKNYHRTLRNFPEERRSHLLRVESLKTRILKCIEILSIYEL